MRVQNPICHWPNGNPQAGSSGAGSGGGIKIVSQNAIAADRARSPSMHRVNLNVQRARDVRRTNASFIITVLCLGVHVYSFLRLVYVVFVRHHLSGDDSRLVFHRPVDRCHCIV